jgi:uncharacterized membrane protein YbhN (UPF0104 family)
LTGTPRSAQPAPEPSTAPESSAVPEFSDAPEPLSVREPPAGAESSLELDNPTPDEWIGAVYIGRRANFIRRHRQVVTLLVLVISIATCLVLCWTAGFKTIPHRLAHLSLWFAPVMVVAHLTAYSGYAIAHHQVVNRLPPVRISWRRNVQVVIIGFGGWLVGGGFTVDRHALEAAGVDRRDATTSIIALGLLELLVLTPATWACALALVNTRGIAESVTLPWIIGVPVGFAIVLSTALIRARPDGVQTSRLRAAVNQLGTAARAALALDPRRGALAVAGIAVYWAADIIALWAALRLLGVALAFPQLILAYATGYILTRRTLPFAGAIIIEVLLAVSLWAVGPSLASAALAVMLYRLSDFVLTLGAALLASSAAERTLTFIAEAEAEVQEQIVLSASALTEPD